MTPTLPLSPLSPTPPLLCLGSALVSAVPGRGPVSRGHHHRLLLLLPGGQELPDHGLLQENGATGELMRVGVWCSLGAFSINKPSLK